MKRSTIVATAISCFLLLAGAKIALAASDPGCAALGGDDSGGTCLVPAGTHNASGFIIMNETLHLLPSAQIVTGAAGIQIGIQNGDFIMAMSSMIDGSVAGCNTGGPITIKLENGNVDLQMRSIIRSNSCSGGAIELRTSNSHTMLLAGLIESVGSITGTGDVQPPGGGTITIVSGCQLTLADTGKVSSRGTDPGADLVHLEGCTVLIKGLVESTGAGHAIPNNPPNHCNLHPLAHPKGASDAFTACVEIWAGNDLFIDGGPNASPPPFNHYGQVNADVGQSGGTSGRGWIDLYAHNDITVRGMIDPLIDDTPPPEGGGCSSHVNTLSAEHPGCNKDDHYAVHANGGLGVNTDDGGLITIVSTLGKVVTINQAVQASSTNAGGTGGDIKVEAGEDILFGTSSIQAKGSTAHGGHIGTPTAPVRSYTGGVFGTLPGELNATGGDPADGTVVIQGCTSTPYTGTVLPALTTLGLQCSPDKPTIPDYVSLPAKNCPCAGATPACPPDVCVAPPPKTGGGGTTSGTKFNDLNGNGLRDSGEPGLSGWVIRLFNSSGVLVDTQTTNGLGIYAFVDLDAGSYTACEVPQDDWEQTCPSPGTACNGNATSTASCALLVPGGGVGHAFTLAADESDSGNDFGNHESSPPPPPPPLSPPCPEDPKAVLTKTVDPSKAQSGINYQTVQAAYDAAVNDDVIGMFSNTTENVYLGGSKSLTITQCTTAKITAKDSKQPVWEVASTGSLTIIGPDAVGGTIGWLVGGHGNHELKSVRANGASQYGIVVNSNNNAVSWNDASDNGVGVQVNGNGNVLKGGDASSNTHDGVQINGNDNTLSGATMESNGGNGVTVNGKNNTIKGNDANKNSGDGFNNGGSGNEFKGNSSNSSKDGGKNENGGAEYRFISAGDNGGSNRADNVNVPSASKCPDFATAGSVCE